MTKKQWLKRFKKKLSALPRGEQEAAVEYYTELFNERIDRGESETEIINTFGSPEQAAVAIACEKNEYSKIAYQSSGGLTAGRFFAVTLLFVFVGIPVLVVIFVLGVTAVALLVSAFAMIAAGIAQALYFLIVQLIYGFSAGFLAQIGIGVAAAGLGFLLVPLFLRCLKWIFKGCAKMFTSSTRLICEKRRA